jgi:Fic family protein
MAIVVKRIHNNQYYYFQDTVKTKTGKFKLVDTMICRTDKDMRIVNNRKEEIFPKHLYKIVCLSTQNIKSPSYRFENKPSYCDMPSLELSKLIYKEILNDITTEEKNHFETMLFVRYVHGTTAIEGNTLNEGETYNLLINDLTPSNKTSSEVAEITNYRILKEYLDNYTSGQIDERLIKRIHRILVDRVIGEDGKYIPPGEYRTGPSGIKGASCKVSDAVDISHHTKELLLWYSEGIEKNIHPLELATIFHHRFERIHAFSDGNGRVGRALLDIMLKRDGFPRIYILWTSRSKYLDALEEANFKNYVPLLDFTITRMAATMTYLYAKTGVYDTLISPSYIQQYADFGVKDIFVDFSKLIKYYRKSTELP